LSVSDVSVGFGYKKQDASACASRRKSGPKTSVTDERLIELIKEVINGLPFHGIGYKKITRYVNKILQKSCESVGKDRVLRLLKVNNLQLKRPGGSGSSRPHDGRITTDCPNLMWGTDGKKFWTRKDGWCWFFGVIDHFNSEIISFHCSKIGSRFEAITPVTDSLLLRFGSLETGIAAPLKLRVDLGSQYMSDYFQTEMKYFGIELSPTFARSPESNGIIERFHRTLQEQVFDIHQFADINEAIQSIKIFIDNYNTRWILERLNYETPSEYRKIYENSSLKECA